MANTPRFILIGLASLALTACGGGGGGGSGNKAPIASFTATPTTGQVPLAVAFDASASSDPDGTITGYSWNFGDSSSGTGVSTSHTYTTAGTYTVTLTVTDNGSATGTTTRTISVTANKAPIASFTATPSTGQVPLAVAFDASASSDPDGTITGYSWNFGDSSSGTGVSTSHTYTTAGAYTVTLTVTDNGGATGSTTRTISATSGPPPTSVTVSGRISFERVPFSTVLGSGLDYTRTFEAPAREIEVELLQASNQAMLATTLTDANGNYSFSATPSTDVIVRAKARSRHAGVTGRPASWDVSVRNNTNGNALYVLDSSTFNTGVADQVRNLKAATGWGGGFSGTYTGVRAAAPFAVLDTLYAAAQFVIAQGDDTVQLAALDVFWSEKNVPVDGDVTKGEIGTTAYYPVGSTGISPGIYVLGAASNDTDEFDQHVMAHEFQHYLEDVISRSDTVGGSHSLDERLDMRVAFSEGYANAFCAMVLSDPLYRDSYGTAQGSDSHFSVETRTTTAPGWYSETSVHRIVWDLFDSTNDGADTVSLGYGPIFDVFTSELRSGVPLTSLFAFITALKQRPGVPVTQVDQLVEGETISTSLGIVSKTMDAYATTETHSAMAATSASLVLPVYTPIALNGSTRLCTSSTVTASDGTTLETTYNKLGSRRVLRFNVPSARTIRITVSCPSSDPDCSGSIVPDPDFVVRQASSIKYAESSTPRTEVLDYPAAAGDYTLEIYDWSHIDLDLTASDRRGLTCMTVSITG